MATDIEDDLAITLRRYAWGQTSWPWIKWVGARPPGELASRLEGVLARTRSTACPVMWAGARWPRDGTVELHLVISGRQPRITFPDLTAREAQWMERVTGEPLVVRVRDEGDLLAHLVQRYAPIPLEWEH